MRLFRKRKEGKSAYLLYDSDCGVCSRFVKTIRLFDSRKRIIPVALRDQLSRDLVGNKLSREEMHASFHLVEIMNSGEKRIFSAGDGVVQLLGYLPFCTGAKSFIDRAKILRSLFGWSYLQTTRLRTASCKVDHV